MYRYLLATTMVLLWLATSRPAPAREQSKARFPGFPEVGCSDECRTYEMAVLLRDPRVLTTLTRAKLRHGLDLHGILFCHTREGDRMRHMVAFTFHDAPEPCRAGGSGRTAGFNVMMEPGEPATILEVTPLMDRSNPASSTVLEQVE